MSLQEFLLQAQPELVEQWFLCILNTYPAGTAEFLAHEPDRFRNPVGQTTKAALAQLFAGIVRGVPANELRPPLDEIIRIRAVQDFRASSAVGFLPQLKPLIRQRLREASATGGAPAALNELEARIDTVALLAFDIYMECREQIYTIKSDAARRRTQILLEHLNRKGGGD